MVHFCSKTYIFLFLLNLWWFSITLMSFFFSCSSLSSFPSTPTNPNHHSPNPPAAMATILTDFKNSKMAATQRPDYSDLKNRYTCR
ncbi:hypothetical protein FKM82_012177 [Ascaphus truei]